MKKNFVIYILFFFYTIGLYAQATKYKGTMTVGDYVRENVVVEVIENGSKAEGTIFDAKFSRLMPITVDAQIKDLNRTVQNGKVFISGNNIIPRVKNKPKKNMLLRILTGLKRIRNLV